MKTVCSAFAGALLFFTIATTAFAEDDSHEHLWGALSISLDHAYGVSEDFPDESSAYQAAQSDCEQKSEVPEACNTMSVALFAGDEVWVAGMWCDVGDGTVAPIFGQGSTQEEAWSAAEDPQGLADAGVSGGSCEYVTAIPLFGPGYGDDDGSVDDGVQQPVEACYEEDCDY